MFKYKEELECIHVPEGLKEQVYAVGARELKEQEELGGYRSQNFHEPNVLNFISKKGFSVAPRHSA